MPNRIVCVKYVYFGIVEIHTTILLSFPSQLALAFLFDVLFLLLFHYYTTLVQMGPVTLFSSLSRCGVQNATILRPVNWLVELSSPLNAKQKSEFDV